MKKDIGPKIPYKIFHIRGMECVDRTAIKPEFIWGKVARYQTILLEDAISNFIKEHHPEVKGYTIIKGYSDGGLYLIDPGMGTGSCFYILVDFL